jgi:predicted DNA-binding transcriptional regulator AlpA
MDPRTEERYGVLPVNGFVRERELLEIIPFSHATLWRKVKTGEFPAPVKLSDRITAWRADEVRGWMESRASGER